MIQIIGLMIGVYITTRYAEMYEDEKKGLLFKIWITLALLLNCLLIFILLFSGLKDISKF